MIGIVLMAAAAQAQAPMLLAANDELRWRSFVRASLQAPRPPAARAPAGSRLRQLQGVVRALAADRPAEIPGPSGL